MDWTSELELMYILAAAMGSIFVAIVWAACVTRRARWEEKLTKFAAQIRQDDTQQAKGASILKIKSLEVTEGMQVMDDTGTLQTVLYCAPVANSRNWGIEFESGACIICSKMEKITVISEED